MRNMLELHRQFDSPPNRQSYVTYLNSNMHCLSVSNFLDNTGLWPSGGTWNAAMYKDLPEFVKRGFGNAATYQDFPGLSRTTIPLAAAPALVAPAVNVLEGAHYYQHTNTNQFDNSFQEWREPKEEDTSSSRAESPAASPGPLR